MVEVEKLMSSASGRVLVMGCDNRSFLAVIRSLGRDGLKVHVAGAPLDASALQSRFIVSVHHLPDYGDDNKQWLSAFTSLLEQYKFDLVIPCNDQSIIPLQSCRSFLKRFEDQLYLLDQNCYAVTNDKQKTWELARKLGIPVPRQMTVSTIEELQSAIEQFGFPLALKPRSSFSESSLDHKQLVELVTCANELERLKLSMQDRRRRLHLVQEFCPGIGVGVEVLCRDGEILTAFQHERVHEPSGGGGSTYRKSVRLDPELIFATSKLMAALRYTGVCMVEFRYDRGSRKWVLLEMNGRFWGSLPLAIAAGVDFPLYLYEALCLGRSAFPQHYKVNIFCRNSSADLAWLARSLRTHFFSTIGKVLLESRHTLIFRERNDTFVLDDLAPGCREWRLKLTRVTLKVLARLPGSSQWLRWRIKRKKLGCRTVLFVCKGNVCRSPFAAGLFAQISRRKVRVISAGFYRRGRSSPLEAIEAASDWGVQLREHKSSLVTDADVRQADLIMVFDLHQAAVLRTLFPNVRGKMVLLGAIDGGPVEIPDPFGKSVEQFRSAYRRITIALERMTDILALEPEPDHGITSEMSKVKESEHRRRKTATVT